jgi:hypothetical protein
MKQYSLSGAALILVAAFLVVIAAPALAQVPSSPPTSQSPSATPQEPTTLGELFRLDQATGAPTALERVKVKIYDAGGPSRHRWYSYIEGRASPVAFKAGERQVFVIRLLSPGGRYGVELNSQEVQKHISLMRLAIAPMGRKKQEERFLTETDNPLDVQTYGQLMPGLDPKNPNRVAQLFRLTPDFGLTPGEYLIRIVGLHNFELAKYFAGEEDWAFGIVVR